MENVGWLFDLSCEIGKELGDEWAETLATALLVSAFGCWYGEF
jgi:hypothetical protein